MKLEDIVHGAWCLTEEAHSTVLEAYARHARGEAPDFAAIEAQLGRPLQNQPARSYDLQDGIATIHLSGILGKRMNLLQAMSGGTSTQMFRTQLEEAVAAPDVQGIILAIDSPGGTADGTQQAADAVYAARAAKPVVAVGDGMIASAAYWIGSAASKLFLADGTTMAGSIGVRAEHVDRSAADEKAGIRRTVLVAGRYKAAGNDDSRPLSEEDRAILEDRLNSLYTVFVDGVARNLGISSDAVLARLADGRVFVGKAAVDIGLAHGIATMAQVRSRMLAGEFKAAGRSGAPMTNQEKRPMTLEELRNQHPDLVAQIEQSASASADAAGYARGLAEGASAELARIRDVEAQALPGHADLIQTLKYDGKTSGAQAALQILAAERAKLTTAASNLRSDAQAAAAVGADVASAGAATTSTGTPEEQARAKFAGDAALQKEFGTIERFLAYNKAQAAGGLRRPASASV